MYFTAADSTNSVQNLIERIILPGQTKVKSIQVMLTCLVVINSDPSRTNGAKSFSISGPTQSGLLPDNRTGAVNLDYTTIILLCY